MLRRAAVLGALLLTGCGDPCLAEVPVYLHRVDGVVHVQADAVLYRLKPGDHITISQAAPEELFATGEKTVLPGDKSPVDHFDYAEDGADGWGSAWVTVCAY